MEIGRYRSYTSYSEENGKLVPSKEPLERDSKFNVVEGVSIVDRLTGQKWPIIAEEKKLKPEVKVKELPTASKTQSGFTKKND